MAGEYLEVNVGDKGIILVDVTPQEGLFPAGAKPDIKQLKDAFEKGMNTVRVCAEGFADGVAAIPAHIRPQEVSLEFGITFKSEVGAVVAKMSTDANFKITATWKEVDVKKSVIEPAT